MKDLRSVLILATEFLKKQGISLSRRTAESLLAHHLELKRIELYMHFDRPLTEEELAPFRESLKRAKTGEPLEYILGEIEFFHTKIRVEPGVLIPRQETEILLDFVCKALDGTEKKALDLCTGSGCLAAALKNAKPDLEVTGVDISDEALTVAKQNSKQVRWLKGDLTAPVREEKFDLVICNPPYITSKDYQKLDCGVRDFEPRIALESGPSGYEFFERLQEELPSILHPGAKVFFEIGTGQGEGMKQLFSREIWEDLHLEPDWAGHDRFFWLKMKEISPIMN